MSRKTLSHDAGLSERYVAQLEAGQGNISIMLLRQIAKALNTPLESLVYDGPEASPEFTQAVEFLRQLQPSDVERAYGSLVNSYGSANLTLRGQRIALIGLKGASESTLSARLAAELGIAFVELDREIEQGAYMADVAIAG